MWYMFFHKNVVFKLVIQLKPSKYSWKVFAFILKILKKKENFFYNNIVKIFFIMF